MPATTGTTGTSRTAHLLALMKKGDDAFNARDFAAVDEVHHPDMIAYIPGLAEPVYGKEAHAAAMQQFLRIFPDMHVYSDPYPIQFGTGDWITVVTQPTGTFSGEMTLPDGTVIPPTGKAFDLEFGQTTKWDATSSSSSPPSTTPPCSAGSGSAWPPSESYSRARRRVPRRGSRLPAGSTPGPPSRGAA